MKDWKIEYAIPDIPASLKDAGYSPLLARVLMTRGVVTAAQARKELASGPEVITDPFRIKDVSAAVERIRLAIRRREKLAVYGDYDVDGITATCLLSDYLRSCGLEVTSYIPDRNEEGYGLNFAALDSFSESGISLVITVDCGITAIEESAHAASLGIDMIITDHHECRPGELPNACAVLDCKRPDDENNDICLAGVGMAFKLACAIEGSSLPVLQKYADFLAVGTVADVMPLTGENRTFVRMGLEMIHKSPRPGFAAMLEEAGIRPEDLNAGSIGFTLAPRINAAGRLNRAILAYDLLITEDPEEATRLAAEICELNRQRQMIENDIWHQASAMIEGAVPDGPIVLASDDWHQGVIGIAASRLAEQYGLPTIMIYMNEDDVGKGSCRSYGGFNLFDALSACSDSLISFGGHALAAGLNIRRDMLEDFRRKITEYYRNNRPEPTPELVCDLLIADPSLLSVENVRSLEQLEPFGNANPRPVMCMCGVTVASACQVGSGKHLKMTVTAGNYGFNCIFFNHKLEEYGIQEGDFIDIAFTPQINEYRGAVTVQLNVKDLRIHDYRPMCEAIVREDPEFLGALAPFVPRRPDFVRIWRSIDAMDTLASSMSAMLTEIPSRMIPEMYCISLKVFEQAGLLSSMFGGHTLETSKKADLFETELMKLLKDFL